MSGSTKRKVGIGCGLGTLVVVILVSVGAQHLLPSDFQNYIFVLGQPVVAISQDEENFDPIQEKDHVVYLAGDETGFISMRATGVRRDGTVDLTSDVVNSRVTYEFSGQEMHADTALTSSQRMQKVTIDAYPKGKRLVKVDGQEDVYQHEIGLRKETSSGGPGRYRPWPFPTCSLRTLWDHATKSGTPESAVAEVEFKEGKYTFIVRDTEYQYHFDQACNPTDRQ